MLKSAPRDDIGGKSSIADRFDSTGLSSLMCEGLGVDLYVDDVLPSCLLSPSF